MKYNKEMFFIYTPFLSNSPTGQTAHHIFIMRTPASVCLFWLWLILQPI